MYNFIYIRMMHTYIHTYTSIRMGRNMYMYMYIHIHIHPYMHTYIYIHVWENKNKMHLKSLQGGTLGGPLSRSKKKIPCDCMARTNGWV